MTLSAGMLPEQPLPGLELHDPLHCRKACPEFNSSPQRAGWSNYSWEGLLSGRPHPKRGKICDAPPPPHVEPARVPLHDTLRRAHHSFLTRCIGWQKNSRVDNPTFYLDTPIKTGSESIEATLRRRRILFAEFVARMEDTILPKCVMFGELVGGAGCVGGQEKEWMGCFLDDLRAFGITSGRLQPRTRGNGAGRQNKGRNISW